MPHKFILGQAVGYTPPPRQYASPGVYIVTAKLPERDGEFEYHIKHTSELHERIAKESDLPRGPPMTLGNMRQTTRRKL
jgi:hypothetical protein